MNNPLNSHDELNLRAGDADRERIAEILRTHHAEGRLDSEELQQRIDACYDAKTLGELEALLHDLPHEHVGRRDRAARDAWPPIGPRRMRRLSPLVLALIAIAIVTGHFVWFLIPLAFLAFRFVGPSCRRRPRAGGHWA